jgi:MFS transporter, ACS family, glucarate transporter
MQCPELNKTARVVISLAVLANVLGYMDRVCISVLAPQLGAEFHFSETQMGLIFGAFSFSYAMFQAPWGMFADRRGARQLVAAVLLSWSVFTGLTAAAWSFASMFVFRLLFGISEAALSPAIASAFSEYVYPERRSTAFGFFLAGGRVGGMLAPLLATALLLRYGWRSVFLILAVSGLFVLPAWLRGFPCASYTPDSAPKQKTRLPHSQYRSVILLVAVATMYTMMWQFYATWYPTYLLQSRGFSLQKAGVYTSLPFLFGLVATSLGGLLSDALAKALGLPTARRLIVVSGLLTSSMLVLLGLVIARPEISALSIAFAAGAGDLSLSTLWATAVEVGGSASGSVSGVMNCFSNLGGFAAPVLIGWMLQRHVSWTVILSLEAVLNASAALLWFFVRISPPDTASKEAAIS